MFGLTRPFGILMITVLLASFLGMTLLLAIADRERVIWQFVHDVLLYDERVGFRDQVWRWPPEKKIIEIATIAGSNIPHVFSVINEINEVLDGIGPQLVLVRENSDTFIYFGQPAELLGVAERADVDYAEGAEGMATVRAEDGSIFDAVVLISTDLRDTEIRSFVLEELTQSLGPTNDSALVRNSIFFETAYDWSNVPKLSNLDKKLLRFLYGHLRPGDRATDVRAAFDRYWDGISVD